MLRPAGDRADGCGFGAKITRGTVMISKPLTEIQLPDIRRLLGNVREGKTIEYKQAMPAKTDKEVIQFLGAPTRLAGIY
jgi:hypothetical protein